MSDDSPYRVPDTDLRPALGSYSSSARHHASPQNDFYRPHQEPPPPSHQSSFSAYPSASSSRGTSAVTPPLSQGSMDGALGILNSCGLEPSDLSLLAELPESLLTVDSLPRLLQQLKGKRGTIKPSPHNAPSSSSSPSSSYSASVVRQPAGKWDHLHSQLVQYPLDHVASLHPPSEQVQERWGKQTSSSVSYTPSTRSDLPPPPSLSSSSSSSRYLVDYNNRASSSDYGKTARDAGPASSQDRGTFRSTGRSRGSRFSQADYRSVPPPEENHQRTWQGRRKAEPSPSSSSRVTDTKPSTKQGRDFHGMMPVVYPYSCSLCDITVLSEKVWIQHVNSTQHADRQLSLLQRFPNWDCRMETINRDEEQSQKKKDEGIPAQLPQAANQNSKPQSTKKAQKKTSEKGKVACVKFPHQSVDEAYLRKLSEPFGKVVKILIFPSLAFVEMGSIDQVKDLVKFHNNYPPTVNGVQMEFSISDTFNFLQSTRVVSFSPAPAGEEGQSDLLSIVKRFGQPLYTLFLPSMAYVEMKNAADAEKLVEYYSSNTLRVNKDQIKVSFSGEYKVLMRVPSAKRYEEETCSTKSMKGPSGDQEDKKSQSKRTRSRSGDREDKTSQSKRTRSRSGDREDKTSQSKRTRSRSGEREDKTNRSKRTRSRSGDREEKTSQSNRTKSPSRDREDKTSRSNETRSSRSNGEKTRSSTDRRSRSRDKSREKSSSRSSEQNRSRENKSRSREKRSRSQEKQSRSREITVVPEKPIESKPEFKGKAELPTTACEPEPEEKESSELEAESSAEESDIEGMEVIGEDLENEDLESLDDDDVEEENEEEKEDSPEQDGKKEEKDAEAGDQEKKDEEEEESPSCRAAEETAESQLEDKEEPDFPLDLENCITLDEVEELNEPDTEGICVAQEEEEENRDDPEGASTQVVHFKNLPLHRYTVDEFLGLVKGFGRATRYLLHSDGQQGFIEMSSCSEAQRAVTELSCPSVSLNGSKLNVAISHKYSHLSSGSIVPWDMDETTERVSQNSSSKSNTSERDESGGRKKSSKNTPERDSMSEKTPEKDAMSENTPERESMSEKTPEKDAMSEKTPEKDAMSENTPERESMSEKTPERESMSEKTPERESASVEILKTESDTCKTAEEDLCKDKTSSEVEPVCNEETSDSGEKIPDEPDSPVDSLRAGNEEEAAAGPAEAAAAPLKPSKPVGTEYVRPVVGYFCNLCQVIYADEDEAKQQHCSSLSHYTKYQEVTGKDPWMN